MSRQTWGCLAKSPGLSSPSNNTAICQDSMPGLRDTSCGIRQNRILFFTSGSKCLGAMPMSTRLKAELTAETICIELQSLMRSQDQGKQAFCIFLAPTLNQTDRKVHYLNVLRGGEITREFCLQRDVQTLKMGINWSTVVYIHTVIICKLNICQVKLFILVWLIISSWVILAKTWKCFCHCYIFLSSISLKAELYKSALNLKFNGEPRSRKTGSLYVSL